MGSGYRRTKTKRPASAHSSKRGRATTQRCVECVRSTWGKYRPPERAASSARIEDRSGPLLRGVGRQVFLEFAGQFDESRREADVLVDRIALIVARNDFRAPLVRDGGGNFVQGGAEQVGNEDLDGLAGKQFAQGVQARGIVEAQAHGILLRGARRCRIFLPTVEQGLEFHG